MSRKVKIKTKLIMQSLFSSVASRCPGISTCVKGGVTHCKHWFWVKLALVTFVSTFILQGKVATLISSGGLSLYC